MTAIVFVAMGSAFSASSIEAERQSQTTTNVCNGDDDSCYTTICSDDQPCYSFPSNEPSPMQPAEETTIMEPVEETTIMEPVDDELEGDEEDTFRVDDSQNYLNPVSEEDTPITHEDDERDQEEDSEETEEHIDDGAHEKFEQALGGIPEEVEVETESRGMGIFVDFIIFGDQQNRMIENPSRYYNGGPLELQRGGTITFSFADCHTECERPEAIRSVYLVDGNIDDNEIIEGKVDDGQKAIFEQIDLGSFQFRVPDGFTPSNAVNKLVIETDQTDEIVAFYIHEGVKIS